MTGKHVHAAGESASAHQSTRQIESLGVPVPTRAPRHDGGPARHLLRSAWQIGTFRPRLWAQSWVAWSTFFLVPLLSGWILKQTFDALATDEAVAGWMLALGLTEFTRFVFFAFAIWFVVRWWVAGLTMMRTNILRAQTVSGGPHRRSLPVSPAEAITRFHDDVRDAVVWSDSWLDGFGNAAYTVGALVIMATIDVRASFVVLVPLVVVTVVTGWVRPRLYAADAADREATGVVTGFLGEAFAGVLAFRLAAREPAAIERLERHTARRRRTAVRKVMLEQGLDGFASTVPDVMIGLMLLVLAPSVRNGDISIGDVALFVSYAGVLGAAPRYLSRLVTAGEQARVSLGRLQELVAAERPDDLMADVAISIDRGDPEVDVEADPPRDRLDRLEIVGLTARYSTTGGGVSDIDLVVDRGQFVVVTGPVGSGKSTLLRAVAGLIEPTDGAIVWNGSPIDDVGAWMVPPRAAHLPQVPRLFSESLVDNIALGRSTHALDEVLDAVALRVDLADMPDGVETRVGARGLRLSGGQAQRVAAARSLLTSPELLLIDDLSSAVDVETERTLWQHVRARGSTVIAVSHRAFVLAMADQVVHLDDGRCS